MLFFSSRRCGSSPAGLWRWWPPHEYYPHSSVNFSVHAEAAAMEGTVRVDPKGIELILGLISKSVPPAASAKAQDFYDPRFFTKLRDSGFPTKFWGEQ